MEESHSPVAFTASATISQSFASSSVVKFDKVQINYGNHYDPTVSTFLCPVTGLYLVSVKVDEKDDAGLTLEVLVAGSRVIYLWDHANRNSVYMSVSGSAVVECQQGSKIWVQSTGSGQIAACNEGNIFSVLLVSKL